jgi:hypothetical protein
MNISNGPFERGERGASATQQNGGAYVTVGRTNDSAVEGKQHPTMDAFMRKKTAANAPQRATYDGAAMTPRPMKANHLARPRDLREHNYCSLGGISGQYYMDESDCCVRGNPFYTAPR